MQRRSGSSGPPPLPSLPLKARVHNGLRLVKQRWRRQFPPRIAPWPGADGVAPRASVSIDGEFLRLHAETVPLARTAGEITDLATPVTTAEITVARWRRPWPGWSGPVAAVAGLVECAIRLPASDSGPASVTVAVTTPTPAQTLVDAALTVLDPGPSPAAALTAEVALAGPRPPWLRGGTPQPREATTTGIPRQRTPKAQPWTPLARTDVELRAARPDGAGAADATAHTRYGVRVPGQPERILIDPGTANPARSATSTADRRHRVGDLTLTDTAGEVWWRVHTSGRAPVLVVAGRAGDLLDDAQRAALSQLGTLRHADADAACAEQAQAAVLAQLAATGIVIETPDLRPATRALLADELVTILRAPAPAGDDPVDWELRSIAQRRAALRGHDPVGVSLLAGQPAPPPPTVTALLVTRRPGYLATAIRDLAAQTYPNLDVVIGLHGVELAADDRDRLTGAGLPVEILPLPATMNLGQALSETTRAARGSLVTKVDDDDRYGPEHIWDLVLARRFSGATLVGKAAEFVHLAAYDVTVRRRMANELYSDVVAGGTMLLSRGDLEHVGGWRPVPRSVDRALLDRVLSAGGLIYRTHGFGFIYSRHGDGHTWDPGDRYFLLNPQRHWRGHPPYAEFGTGR